MEYAGVDERETSRTEQSRCARDTLASRRSPSSLPSATPFFPLFSPWATWSRTGRHGNPRQSRWKLNRGTLSVLSPPFFLSLSIPLSPTSLFALRPSPTSPTCQRIRIPLSLCRFQIISRPIVLLLTTRRPLCPHPLIVPATKSSPPRPRAPSLASRPVSLV